MTDHEWPGAEHVRKQLTAQLAVEARFPGWQVLHTTCDRWVRNVWVPEGYFYAVHFKLSEPPQIAAGLDRLADLVKRRQHEEPRRWAVGSIPGSCGDAAETRRHVGMLEAWISAGHS